MPSTNNTKKPTHSPYSLTEKWAGGRKKSLAVITCEQLKLSFHKEGNDRDVYVYRGDLHVKTIKTAGYSANDFRRTVVEYVNMEAG